MSGLQPLSPITYAQLFAWLQRISQQTEQLISEVQRLKAWRDDFLTVANLDAGLIVDDTAPDPQTGLPTPMAREKYTILVGAIDALDTFRQQANTSPGGGRPSLGTLLRLFRAVGR